jgi:hypothetical protein
VVKEENWDVPIEGESSLVEMIRMDVRDIDGINVLQVVDRRLELREVAPTALKDTVLDPRIAEKTSPLRARENSACVCNEGELHVLYLKALARAPLAVVLIRAAA